MSNPFAELNISDDEQQGGFQKTQEHNKVKRTHQEKKNFKKQQETNAAQKPESSQVVEQPLPERFRDDRKVVGNRRAPPKDKDIGEGHTLDRRSGTGRVDKVRKEGGGKGNIGNVKDDLNQEKYLKEGQETTHHEAEEPAKPEEPQGVTLEEYYKSKGVDINNTVEKKVPVKKTEVNAEWIKKEKLTVLETKEDKRNNEKPVAQGIKVNSVKAASEDPNLQLLGFGKAPEKKHHDHEHRDHKEHQKDSRGEKHHHKGGKKAPAFNLDDFPTL